MQPGEPDRTAIMLGLLSAVEGDDKVTQRRLAAELGIALGLVNTYLKRCVRKGWVKISHVPMRRYSYYLTPQGFAEKARLTTEYLSVSLSFFRRAREDATRLLNRGKANGWSHFVLVGYGDLAEVAMLSATESGVTVVAVYDPQATAERCAGRPVVQSFDKLMQVPGSEKVEALMVTASDTPVRGLEVAQELAGQMGLQVSERLLVPGILGLTHAGALASEGAP